MTPKPPVPEPEHEALLRQAMYHLSESFEAGVRDPRAAKLMTSIAYTLYAIALILDRDAGKKGHDD